jgi:hypothetical protein
VTTVAVGSRLVVEAARVAASGARCGAEGREGDAAENASNGHSDRSSQTAFHADA